MWTKYWGTWRVTFVMLALLTSVYLGGCQAVTPTKAAVPSSGTTEPSEIPHSPEMPQVPTPKQKNETIPENRTEPVPEQKTEPIPEQKTEAAPLVLVDESDNNPSATPPSGSSSNSDSSLL